MRHMTYDEARNWLEGISKKGGSLGLERMYDLVRELGDPQKQLKFIHIAGTNGKGSVMTYLEHTLNLAGYRVGRYLSPALFCYEERIRVKEQYIAKDQVAELSDVLRAACERLEAAGKEIPTIFEVETAMAFLHFQRSGCEIVLLECGMGGETDATNVVENTILEVFSSISLDHAEYLGDTVEKIAQVKAGILKAGSAAVSDRQSAGVRQVLCRKARERNVPIRFVDEQQITVLNRSLAEQSFRYKNHENMKICMAGTWQVRNACLALEAVDELRDLGYDLSESIVRKGFAGARLEGRFEAVRQKPTVIMDGAHNPEAALRLRETLEAYFPGKRLIYIMGVFADKDYSEEIALTAPLAKRIYTVQTKDNPRALDAAVLAEAVRRVNPDVVCAGSVPTALEQALAEAGDEDVIILFGSISWLHEAREYLGGEDLE
ncbi:MAG: bifunctional folylpolyglutamate synthase/dihydrofolate synthase [Lachnospiraceae bacterium]|nr:bifunctional folylpolyglutamate synthase/dihydrofolate synthase [Lachnospiraceae bacterium]